MRQQAASSAPTTRANTKKSKRKVTFGPPTCIPPEESGFHVDEPTERRTKRARTRPHPSTKHKKETSPVTAQAETPSDQPPTQRKRAALLGTTTAARPPKKPRSQVHASLASYDATHGTQHTETRGKSRPNRHSPSSRRSHCQHPPAAARRPTYTSIYHIGAGEPNWRHTIPTPSQLLTKGFGRPDRKHSATQTASFETSILLFLKYGSGYLDQATLNTFKDLHPLIHHMHKMIPVMAAYDFTWIREIDSTWATQTTLNKNKLKAYTAALYHYNFNVSFLMRMLGNNYTGAHRNVQYIVERVRPHVEPYLLQHLVRVLQTGAPAYMVAETSRENVLKYWRKGNNPSVLMHADQTKKTMVKEERNNYVIPLHSYLFRYVPHLMLTPQHILVKKGKARQIADLSFRHDEDSISVNMMTPSAADTELRCEFGDVLTRLLTRIWNLRITYPTTDIVITANDIKGCFRQIKHHPDVMGFFSYIINGILYLQCGQTFGSDFSPSNWEGPRRVIEQLAEALFEDTSLREKHRHYLDKLKWNPALGTATQPFTPATADSTHTGVRKRDGTDKNTPQDMFVDDVVLAEVHLVPRVEQAVAASIESIFTVLGESCPEARQDPISWDKLFDMIIDFCNKILGVMINTRTMTVRVPIDYVQSTVTLMDTHWHHKRKTVTISEIEELTGRLGHIAQTSPWLRFMMSEVYTSLKHMLQLSHECLVTTNAQFRRALKVAKQEATTDTQERHKSFNTAKVAKMVHKTKKRFQINKTLRWELRIIHDALTATWIDMHRPIGHMVPSRDARGPAWSDSSLHAAGGYSFKLRFWWYIEWPADVQRLTLRFVKKYRNSQGKLVSINVLEYAAMIITYVAGYHVMVQVDPSAEDPFPLMELWADNTTAESWIIKASKVSPIGRALSRIQCALMINNPVGITSRYISTLNNVIADRISRILRENLIPLEFRKLSQEFPALQHCRRFQPSSELISLVMEALLTDKLSSPLEASRRILSAPGKLTA